ALEDPDGNVTVTAYNGLDEETQSTQGQMQTSSGPWTFNNLALGNGQARTLPVYVYFASAPSGSWQNYSVSDSGGTPTFTASGVTASTGGWYLLGTVTLSAGDNSTSVKLTQNACTTPNDICLGFADGYSYYPDASVGAGQLAQVIDRDGRADVYAYDSVGRIISETFYPTSTLQNPTESITYQYNSA